MGAKKIAVIGGGAAGFFAAIHSAFNGAEVTLFEKSNKLLSKVRVSGGGRCNVTNFSPDPALLVWNYPRGARELRGPFSKFNITNTIEWFQSRGVNLKIEADGRVFPFTDSSETIIKCLLQEAEKNKVKILTGTSVTSLVPHVETIKLHIDNDSGEQVFDKVIIATGGNPSVNSYTWLKQLGHTIISPVPSLFTFNIPDNPFDGLMGISVNPATLKIKSTLFSQTGPLLFTHWGMSGPAVLKLSAWGARWMAEKNYEFNLIINFAGEKNEQVVREELIHFMNSNSKILVFKTPFIDLPSRLWIRLCELSGINEDKKWVETGKIQINNLIRTLTASDVSVKGKTTFKEEFVTCGGIKLSEINFTSMESRIIKNLFFAGEVLDIDGVTGGFNFQSAWTTGWIAGNAASRK